MIPNADGPDVSHWQRVISETAIPSFRLASCKVGEGRSYFDPTAPAWVARFRRNGVRNLGVYFWIRPDSTIDEQFANFVAGIRRLDLEHNGRLDPGVMLQLDWEITLDSKGNPLRPMNVDEIERFVYLAQVRYGDRVIVYGSDWVPGFTTWRSRHPHVPVWYANYNLGDKPTSGHPEAVRYRAAIWQWTSSYKCPGIAGGIDMNHVLDWPVVDRLCGLSAAPPKPTPPTVPPATSTTTALAAAATAGDTTMPQVVADKSNPAAPERWVTNGVVRVAGNEHTIDWLTRTGKLTPNSDGTPNTIRTPELLTPAELAGLPLVPAGTGSV